MIRIKRKKDLRYYMQVFASSIVAILLLATFMHFFRDEAFLEVLERFWALPLLITLLFWAYNAIRGRLFAGFESASEEREFILHMSKTVKEQLDINEEQALKLREDATFQSVMKDAYLVYRDGETDDKNFSVFQSRLDEKKNELVKNAGLIVIEETKKLREKKIRHQ